MSSRKNSEARPPPRGGVDSYRDERHKSDRRYGTGDSSTGSSRDGADRGSRSTEKANLTNNQRFNSNSSLPTKTTRTNGIESESRGKYHSEVSFVFLTIM